MPKQEGETRTQGLGVEQDLTRLTLMILGARYGTQFSSDEIQNFSESLYRIACSMEMERYTENLPLKQSTKTYIKNHTG